MRWAGRPGGATLALTTAAQRISDPAIRTALLDEAAKTELKRGIAPRASRQHGQGAADRRGRAVQGRGPERRGVHAGPCARPRFPPGRPHRPAQLAAGRRPGRLLGAGARLGGHEEDPAAAGQEDPGRDASEGPAAAAAGHHERQRQLPEADPVPLRGPPGRRGPLPGPGVHAGHEAHLVGRPADDREPSRGRGPLRGAGRAAHAAPSGLGRHGVPRLVCGTGRDAHDDRPGRHPDRGPAAQLRGLHPVAAPGGLLPRGRPHLCRRPCAGPDDRSGAAAPRSRRRLVRT